MAYSFGPQAMISDGIPTDIGGGLVHVFEHAVLDDMDPHKRPDSKAPEYLFAPPQGLLRLHALGMSIRETTLLSLPGIMLMLILASMALPLLCLAFTS